MIRAILTDQHLEPPNAYSSGYPVSLTGEM